jgi:hypothetical protein
MQTFVFLLIMAAAGQPEIDLLHRYVQALGGEEALRAVRTRVTSGEFNNGRGLVTPFRIVEQTPNRRVTLIGTHPIDSNEGSGRGFDGVAGWDKNFIGTGLRGIEGQELADLQREADLLRPLHLHDACQTVTVETTADRSGRLLPAIRRAIAFAFRSGERVARRAGVAGHDPAGSDSRVVRRLSDGGRHPPAVPDARHPAGRDDQLHRRLSAPQRTGSGRCVPTPAILRLPFEVRRSSFVVTVFVLIREDQNQHGYIDMSIEVVFREAHVAKEMETLERLQARQEGLVVEDKNSRGGEWQVSWKVEQHLVD